MLFILSIILTFIVILLSAYFIYFYLKPKKEPVTSSKHPVTKPQGEPSISQPKKSKKQKKLHKGETKVTHDEVSESVNEVQADENLNPETFITPVISVSQENTIPDDILNKNLSEIEYLKTEIKKFESEKQTLSCELEEAQEKIAKYREDTETLTEENKTIKSKLTKFERTKSKTDEQLKKLEISNSESIAKNEEIERNLTQKNSENAELKQKFEIFSQKLHKSEMDLKSKQEKLNFVQCEKDDAIRNREEITRKYNELVEKSSKETSDHVEMYRKYDNEIEKIRSEYKQMKTETVNLNNSLQAKEKEITNLKKDLKNLNVQLTKSKEESHNLTLNLAKVSKDLSSKESQTSQVSKENRRLSEDLENLKTEINCAKTDNEVKLQKMSENLMKKDSMLHDLENDKSLLEKEVKRLRKEFENFREINEKHLNNLLESKSKEIENLVKINQELLSQIELTKKEFTEQNTELLREIERLKQDYSVKVEVSNEKSGLLEEITLLKTSCSSQEEKLSKLHEISEELKEKNNDLRVLQDQKMDFLKAIDQLKKEINSRDFSANEKVIELSQTVKNNEIVIYELLNEKKQLETKLEDLKKSTGEKEVYFQNSKPMVEFEELFKKLEKKNEELVRVQHENRELKAELNHANVYYKRQTDDLNENLERKINELNFQNEFCIEWKDKCEKLEKTLQESLNSNRQQLEMTVPVESIIQEIRVEPTESFASSYRTTEEMQSHIVKLESELLALQRKYYDLKNSAITSDDIPESHSKSPANVNIYQSDIISIPPTDMTIDVETISDNKADQSHSASNLLNSIEKLNIEIFEQRLKNQDLQKSFSESSSEKNKLKADYNQLIKEHESVKAKYDSLAEEFYVLRNSTEIQDNNETIGILEEQLKKCQEENFHLKVQLDHYRETLEKTENCLQNIQASVDQEENNWKICLKSSEQEQERLEEKIKELLNQIEELRSKQHSDSPTMIEQIENIITSIKEFSDKFQNIVQIIENRETEIYSQRQMMKTVITTNIEELKIMRNEKEIIKVSVENRSTQEKLYEKINKLKKEREKLKQIIIKLQEEKKPEEYNAKEKEKKSRERNRQNNEIKKLQKENNELKQNVESTKEITKSLHERLQIEIINSEKLYEENEQRKMEGSLLREENAKLIEEIDKLLREMDRKYEKFTLKLKEKETIISELHSIQVSLESNIDQMTRRVKETTEISDQESDFGNKLVELHKEIDTKNLDIITLRNEKLALLTDIERLQDELRESRELYVDSFEKMTRTVVLKDFTTEDEIEIKEQIIKPELAPQSMAFSVTDDAKLIEELQTRIEELLKEIQQLRKEKLESEVTTTDQTEILLKEFMPPKKTSTVVHEKATDVSDGTLNEIFQELEGKNREISVLQDHKSSLIHEIDQLKRELLNKDSEVEMKLKEKNSEIIELERQKIELGLNVEYLTKEMSECVIYRKDGDANEKLVELYKELEIKNHDLMLLKNENSSLLFQFHQYNSRLLSKLQKFDLQSSQKEFIINDCLFPISCSRDIFPIPLVNELQTHIDLLERELLELQSKYFNLKISLQEKIDDNVLVSHELTPSSVETFASHLKSFCDSNEISSKLSSTSKFLDSIEKLNVEIAEQRNKNQELRTSIQQSLLSKSPLQGTFHQLLQDQDIINSKYEEIWEASKCTISEHDYENSRLREELTKFKEENEKLSNRLNISQEVLKQSDIHFEKIKECYLKENESWDRRLKILQEQGIINEDKIKELLNQLSVLERNRQNLKSEETVDQITCGQIVETSNDYEKENEKDKHESLISESIETENEISFKQNLQKCLLENKNLKAQLKAFREVLEETDIRFSKIQQIHVEEESNWKYKIQSLIEKDKEHKDKFNCLMNNLDTLEREKAETLVKPTTENAVYQSSSLDVKRKRKRRHRKSENRN